MNSMIDAIKAYTLHFMYDKYDTVHTLVMTSMNTADLLRHRTDQ